MAASKWAPIRLGDVCSKIGSGATPRGGSDVYLQDGPYALIRSQNVYNDGFHNDGLTFIGETHAEELSNVAVEKDDVLLNITGDSVARCCQVDPSVLPARVNQHVAIIRPDPDKLNPRFLRYFLVSPEMQTRLLSWAGSGGTRNALTKGMIEAFEVMVPKDLSEQCAIAHILGTLDDKIELNRRMNDTLEAIARAIFKSWFVDFAPVRAKAKGRAPVCMDVETAALFPDSFEDSPLGEIPKRWHVGRLGDVLSIIETGGRPKGGVKDIIAGIPSVGAESIAGIGHFDYGKTKFVPHEFFKAMTKGLVQDGDVLLYKDGGRPGEFEPHVTIVGDGFPFDSFCINEHVYRLRTHPQLPQVYLYFWLSSDWATVEMRNRGTGVAIPGLNSTAVRQLAVLLPDPSVVEVFRKDIDGLVQRIFANCNQSRTLATLRDALLPKLISGVVRVKDADRIIESATG
jgi:type I restriction enzyme S subunit